MTEQTTALPEGFTAHTCVTAKCSACGYFHDEEEGVNCHFDSLAEVHATLRSFDWIVLADGRVLCPAGGDDHAELLAAVGLAPDPTN